MIEWLVFLVVVLLFVALLKIVYFRWSHRHIISAALKLPCPPTYPFIGNLLSFTGGNTRLTRNLLKYSKQFRGLFCLWVGPLPIFLMTEPSDIQAVLNNSNNLEKDDTYSVIKLFAGNGLITAPARIWKKTNRLIAPIFNAKNVQLFIPEFNDISRQLCKELDCGGPMDPKQKLFSATIDSVFRTLVGTRSVDSKIKHHIEMALDRMGEFIMIRLLNFWWNIELLFRIVYRSELKLLLDRVQELYAFYNQELKAGTIALSSLEGLDKVDQSQRDLRSNIIKVAWKHPSLGFKDHQWSDEISTLFGAGSDTTATTLRFFLITMANYPEIQEKIRKEISEVMGDSNSDVTLSELEAMSYLNCVLLETMRLHGVVPIIGRKISKDIQLSGFMIPKGSRISAILYIMGWNPDIFPEPEKFEPERFLDNKEANRNFLPFGGGPRRCPGKIYSMLLMKTVAVHLLRKYQVTSPIRMEDIKYEMKMVMSTKNPLTITFKKLNTVE